METRGVLAFALLTTIAGAIAHAQTAAPKDDTRWSLAPTAYIWYAQPIDKGDAKVEIFFASLIMDASAGHFGLHVEPRLRESKMREFFASNVWLQEVYGYAALGTERTWGRIKAGKTYTRFGLFWDGTFANLQYFDGVKVCPDDGVSFEGDVHLAPSFTIAWALQHFVIDGATNGSYTGRDTLSIPGARKRGQWIARIEPRATLPGEVTLTGGLSAQRFRADFTGAPDGQVRRAAVDVTAVFGPHGRVLGEVSRQWGHSVRAQENSPNPVPAAKPFDSGLVDRALAVAQLSRSNLTARAAYSAAHYKDSGTTESFWHPGIVYVADPHFTLMSEWILWHRHDGAGTRTISNSLHLIAHLHY